jgi:hypothetical protein
MPTGYTAPIEDLSKPYGFNDYVWNCARAFDIWCRDNDGNPPVERQRELAAEHRVERVKDLNDSVLRYEQKISDAVARTKETNDYFRALFESVPLPVK